MTSTGTEPISGPTASLTPATGTATRCTGRVVASGPTVRSTRAAINLIRSMGTECFRGPMGGGTRVGGRAGSSPGPASILIRKANQGRENGLTGKDRSGYERTPDYEFSK